jgi:hypothetical protein
LARAKDTYATVHRYAQVVGQIRLALAPPTNHFWHVPLYLTSRGLTTSPIPYRGETFDLTFDFIDHELSIDTSRGDRAVLALLSQTVADFHDEVMAALHAMGIHVRILGVPVEIPGDTTPFAEDVEHGTYDEDEVNLFFRALMKTSQVFQEFRARFTGKCSPVHFFWGSFDLAVTRFSGRLAPVRAGADAITAEAYAEEVCSVGFWPGTEELGGPCFYAYHVPEPPGFRAARVRPDSAYFHEGLNEFLLPYEAVRGAADPRGMLLDFCQSTYEAGAMRAGWDRPRLERPLVRARPVQAAMAAPEPPAAHQ